LLYSLYDDEGYEEYAAAEHAEHDVTNNDDVSRLLYYVHDLRYIHVKR